MWEPFPGNYVWNLSSNLALMCGGNIGEIEAACQPIRDAAKNGEDAGTALFFDSWIAVANNVLANADADLAKGRRLSAGIKYQRAAGYLLTAERMQSRDYAPRWQAYADGLANFRKGVELQGLDVEFVQIPYEGKFFTGLFVPAKNVDGPAPCVVSCNGLDSMKEQIFGAGNPEANRIRGMHTLVIDQPGTGEALRILGLNGRHDAEAWGSAAFDYLLTRDDVDHKRIGMFGLSLGGYFAPRIASMDHRFALCCVMGANHNWGEMQTRRLKREGDNPVPHYWDHVMWVFGKKSLEEFMDWAPNMDLTPVIGNMKCPFFIMHGGGDRQIPVEYAQQSRDQATAAAKVDYFITGSSEYEVEHCGADNGTFMRDMLADWMAETFAEVAR
ncbi:S9 family peptidase [Rhizobium sp. L1K21]|uniref:alpha/beta hydrolase family protein n=1 Tax=Rhizobium sp. L1K21 TaxID=2954933 RepID=UPI002093A016|nr:alpha/beta hydrolase [Rhizobium sp. L1K21]MCO6187583.1 alpha/beta hydrolase [Rhizobium sp. L1K21]